MRIRRRYLLVALFALVALFGLYRFGRWIYYRYTHAFTEDAFVEADIVNISPLVAGHIKRILVDESQRVKKGQLLFVLDDSVYAARVRLAEARLKYARSRLKVLREKLKQAKRAYVMTRKVAYENVKAAEFALAQAEAQFERAKNDYERFRNLYNRRVIGKFKFDRVREQYKRSLELVKIKRSQLEVAKARLLEVKIKKDQIAELQREIVSAKRAVEKAKRALEVAKVDLRHTRVYSPIDGVVAKRYLQVGDFAAAGYPVLALYDTSKVYVLANLEETRFEGVRVGNGVDIWVDAYPGRVFRGRVKKILPASAAKFALIPRDVTAGEFTKVVQRIPIKIELLGEAKHMLFPGMSVEVGIEK